MHGKIYQTTRKPEHFFKRFQGFGISENILLALLAKEVEEVHIKYLGKKGEVIFIASLEKWLEAKETWSFFSDKQRILRTTEMIVKGKDREIPSELLRRNQKKEGNKPGGVKNGMEKD